MCGSANPGRKIDRIRSVPEHAPALGNKCGFRSTSDVHFLHNAVHVAFDSTFADVQFCGNFFVGLASGNLNENLSFTSSELWQRCGVCK